MNFLLALAVMLVTARILGEVFERLGLPSTLGYIVSGIILGPVAGVLVPENIANFGQIGLILLLFVVGFKEIDTQALMRNKLPGILTGSLGAGISFGLTYMVGILFGFPVMTSLFLALAVAATSISFSIASFINLGKMNTRLGRAILGASVVDDIIGLVLLAVLSSIAATGALGLTQLGNIALGIFLFFVLFFVGGYIIPMLMKRIEQFRTQEIRFSIVLTVIILSAYLAEFIGLSVVLGAFIAGIMLSRSPELGTKEFSNDMAVVSHGIFIPLFFAWVGLQIMIIPEMLGLFSITLLAVAILGKAVGAFISGILSSFNKTECLGLAAGMLPRGEVVLVILTVGKSLGLVPDVIFSSVFFLILVTVIITPMLLTLILKDRKIPG